MAEHQCAVVDPFAPRDEDLHKLQADITDALGELRGAREIHAHSPNAESMRDVELCEWRLDTLMGRLKTVMAG